MSKLFRIFTFLCILFLATSVAQAKRAQWKSPTFDFDTVKAVYVHSDLTTTTEANISEFEALKIEELLLAGQKYLNKYRIVKDPELADLFVNVKISNWGKNRYWQEPHTYTAYENITYTDKDGKKSTLSIPVKKTQPGYYFYKNYFTARFTVTDVNGERLFEIVDTREDAKNAHSMFGRAVKDFYKDLGKTKDKKVS